MKEYIKPYIEEEEIELEDIIANSGLKSPDQMIYDDNDTNNDGFDL